MVNIKLIELRKIYLETEKEISLHRGHCCCHTVQIGQHNSK